MLENTDIIESYRDDKFSQPLSTKFLALKQAPVYPLVEKTCADGSAFSNRWLEVMLNASGSGLPGTGRHDQVLRREGEEGLEALLLEGGGQRLRVQKHVRRHEFTVA